MVKVRNGVKVRGLVVIVRFRVRCRVIHFDYQSPHKGTRLYACMFVCVLL